jgi:hypothetical protein
MYSARKLKIKQDGSSLQFFIFIFFGSGSNSTTMPKIRETQCRRLPHEWGLGKGKTEASLPRKICGEAASNP